MTTFRRRIRKFIFGEEYSRAERLGEVLMNTPEGFEEGLRKIGTIGYNTNEEETINMSNIIHELKEINLGEEGVEGFTYEGEKYEMIEQGEVCEMVKGGDIVRSDKKRRDVTKGGYYVVSEDSNRYYGVTVFDNAGEGHSEILASATIFRKVEKDGVEERLDSVEERVSKLEEDSATHDEGIIPGDYIRVVSKSKYGNGEVGEVYQVDEVDMLSFGIVYNVYNLGYFLYPENVEKVEGYCGNRCEDGGKGVKEGDLVSLKYDLSGEPEHGRGGYEPGDIGMIKRITGGKAYVNFPDHKGFAAKVDELVKLRDEDEITIGRKVIVTKLSSHYDDIRVGETAIIVVESNDFYIIEKEDGSDFDIVDKRNVRLHRDSDDMLDIEEGDVVKYNASSSFDTDGLGIVSKVCIEDEDALIKGIDRRGITRSYFVEWASLEIINTRGRQ